MPRKIKHFLPSFGNCTLQTDTPEEMDLVLAQKAHQSLSEIDVQNAGSDQILGVGVDEYPAALPMGKVLSGGSYQMLELAFLVHPAVMSARVWLEYHQSFNFSLLIADLETLETRLGTFLFGLETAVESLPTMVK